jgi:PleD family two-component response regulator
MMTSGEMIGLLHIEDKSEAIHMEEIQDLAQTPADHLSLSLSNLKLCETLRSQSIRDVLTGLYNRRYLEESLLREIPHAIRKESLIGVIMLDIDHFKDFNDTNGHAVGDVILHKIGLLLPKYIRVEDIPCRFGVKNSF